MIRSFSKILVFLFIVSSLFVSCKKDKKNEPEPVAPVNPATPTPTVTPTPTTSAGSGTLTIEFKNMVDTAYLVYGKNYVNPNGDTFKVSKFNYYISNIVITKDDNSTYIEPESYRIISHGNAASKILTLSNVPAGSYKSIKFMLGVDSARNTSGAQTGGLDAVYAADMYWSWAQGYIFFKLEGSSPQSGSTTKSLEYHIGGFGGPNKTQRNFNLNFGTTNAVVTTTTSPRVYLTTNVNEVFKNPTTINFATQFKLLSVGAGAKMYADNYADMISFDHIQN